MRQRLECVVTEMSSGDLKPEAGRNALIQTRRKIEQGWKSIQEALEHNGLSKLATDVDGFVRQIPATQTENERIAAKVTERPPNNTRRESRVR